MRSIVRYERPVALVRNAVGFALLFSGFSVGAVRTSAQETPPPRSLSFNQDIRPILSDHCFACHGFDGKQRQADLRLDTAEGAFAERPGGPAVIPGQPEGSQLWQRITADDPGLRMPPAESHKPLTSDQIETLQAWIAQGAPYQKHWAFEPATVVDPPGLPASKLNPVDGFIQARLAKLGLQPAPPADRPTLIRRVAFALTGLPPAAAEVDLFLRDRSPDAYERMVERFLASPHFGEEMARHWLDLVRYADTHGLHLDNERQTWAFRDWVVDAFNRNQPFDQFTIEQLAGDLLPHPTLEQLVATGFNRCNVTTSEGGSIDAELTYRYAVDRTSTTAATWLGLTAGCAVCHDHKFDPISQREFYSLYAFFNSAADPAMDGNALLTNPVLRLERPEQSLKLAEWDRQIATLQADLDVAAAAIAYVDPALADPKLPAQPVETIWFEDEFPSGGHLQASPGQPTRFVTTADGGQVFSGTRSLQRTDSGLAQDVWDRASSPLVIPAEATIFAYVWLDPANPPQTIMLQFHTDGWRHRAVWGNYDAIQWGAAQTTERVDLGSLPAAGQWVRLEFPAEKVGLQAGDRLTGFALTQFGGSLFWDKVGVLGTLDPARDPSRSFQAWWRSLTGSEVPGLAPDLKELARGGPDQPGLAAALVDRLRTFYLQTTCAETQTQFAKAVAEIQRLRSEREAFANSIPSTFIFRDLPEPRESFVMMRGQYDHPGERVSAGVPAILPSLVAANPAGPPNRLDLARWLVSPENPLTARVAVNRFWQQLFGVGIVKTSSDFGSQGEPPSHPELLDWLAVRFRESGWDVKALVRLLVTSQTFRQSSAVGSAAYERDPENRWYARGPRLRLDAEQIRDNALFVSGLIQLEMGGPGVRPYQPPNIWEPVGFVGSNTQYYRQDHGPALYRRSLYTFFKRTAPPPFLVNFDAPNREQSCPRRERSNTPLQALQLMNDVQHVEAARHWAERLIREGGAEPVARITWAYRQLLARDPAAAETAVVAQQLAAHLERYRATPDDAQKLIAQGESPRDATLDPVELAAYTLVANMLLNLDETLSRN